MDKKAVFMRAGSFLRLIICVLLAVLLLISPIILTEHDCSSDLCVLCLLSSSLSFGTLLFVAFSLILVLELLRCSAHNANRRKTETLVALKRKLSI